MAALAFHSAGRNGGLLLRLSVLFGGMAVATMLHAQSPAADRRQPMEVEADHLEYNAKQRVSHFRGNVQLKKGSIVMRGGQLKVSDRKGEGQVGELRGNGQSPAYFRQSRLKPGESIEGQARRIRYVAARDEVVFSGNARLRRYVSSKVTDEISGEAITYSNRTGVFSVSGAVAASQETGNSTEGKKRVRVVLTPGN